MGIETFSGQVLQLQFNLTQPTRYMGIETCGETLECSDDERHNLLAIWVLKLLSLSVSDTSVSDTTYSLYGY